MRVFEGKSENVVGCTWLPGRKKFLRGYIKFEERNGYITMGTVGGHGGGGDCCNLMGGSPSMNGFGTVGEGE